MVIFDRSVAASPVIPSSLYIALLDTKKLCTSVSLLWMAPEKLSAHSATPESFENAASNFAPVCSTVLPTSSTADPNCFASSIPCFTTSMAAEMAKNDLTAEPMASLMPFPAFSPSFPMSSRSSPVLSASSPTSSSFPLALISASANLPFKVWIGCSNASLTFSAPATALFRKSSARFPA